MKISYDYEELIQELEEELTDRSLCETDTIQILHAQEPIYSSYYPIVDWYYEDKRMNEIYTPDAFDDTEEIKEMGKIKKQYLQDKPHLIEITVLNCLTEMREVNKII